MPLKHSEQELKAIAKSVRRTIIEIVYRAKSSHIGCSLSAADILTVLYYEVLNIDPQQPLAESRDRMILSKGHAVAAVYAILAERGFFPKDKLLEYGTDGTVLASHIVRGALPGLEASTGSGGHGLPLGVGMALAARADRNPARVFVLSGDGELEEGSVWEAALFAGFHKLSNLTVVVDRNNLQDGTDGLYANQILDVEPLDEKLRAFHWEVDTVNGHNFQELAAALNKKTDSPRAVIARTLKGRGVSFMENKGEWHGKCPDADEYALAMKELA